ncbi:Transcription factor mbp1 [Coemansia pectinata]|uniref:Transcription factor mbp1 n=1 Tax=Coemansia pectinata TaxID=1052879 RepID=A0A9W8H050_9FUNG|nr:Transcription factor mbp1 [Coemansia pectinata]
MAGRADNNKGGGQVWSASYAGVEVFQQLHNNTAVMLRRKDSYVNVTQILKCAQYDKPQRTRFLEREIHTGVHEKIQGGYGKYQGTWVPLSRAISLAQELNIYESLKPLFEYNPGPGDSTPTAPRSLEAMTKRKADGAVARPAKVKRRSKGALSDILNQPEAGGSSQSRTSTPQYQQPQATPLPAVGNWAGGGGYNTPNSQPRTNNVHSASGGLPPPVYMGSVMTPENNRNVYTGGRAPWPPTPRDSNIGNPLPVGSRVLRDISNTYNDNSGGNESYQFVKHTPRPEMLMMTPPASSGRRGVAPLQRPSMQDTPTYTRPPPGNVGRIGEFSRVPIISADHSRTASSVSQQQQQQPEAVADDTVARVLALVSRPAGPAGSDHVPAAIEEAILLDRSFDANAEVGGDRTTLLHVATRHGYWGVVRLLLRAGADVARPSRDGTTALMTVVSLPLAYAARNGRVFDWLLDAFEAALIKRDKKGRTVVHWLSVTSSNEPVAMYYGTLLVRKLASCRLTEVVSWCDYIGCSAAKLAVNCGLLRLADVLQQAAAQTVTVAVERSASSASTVSLNSTGSAPVVAQVMTGSLARSGGDRYEAAARKAAGLICAATDELRRGHQQQHRAVDADTEYAAQLLLELSSERDAACADADIYAAVAQQCDAARNAETTLRRKVEQTVGLQHAARSAMLIHESGPVAQTTKDAAELRAEYARLRARAAAYEHESRVLGGEYAELTGVVRPWATGAGGDEAEDTAALCAVLEAEEQRLHKLERVVAAACGDLSLDRVRTVVGPVLSVLNNGNTL